MARGMMGQVSKWWLNRRNLILLYRGQQMAITPILSPLARTQGAAASEKLLQRLRLAGLSDERIAGYSAVWGDNPVPSVFAPPGLGGLPLGSVGIPTTSIPGIAAGPSFGAKGVVYVIRVPREAAVSPLGWQGLKSENEVLIFNQLPPGSIIRVIPGSHLPSLMLDEMGRITPGG